VGQDGFVAAISKPIAEASGGKRLAIFGDQESFDAEPRSGRDGRRQGLGNREAGQDHVLFVEPTEATFARLREIGPEAANS
jgi:hypothetical protein